MKKLLTLISCFNLFVCNAQTIWQQKNDFVDYRSNCVSVDFNNHGSIVTLGYADKTDPIDSCLNTTWQYDSYFDSWIPKANFPGAARFSAVGFNINGDAFVGLGEDCDGNYYSDFWLYKVNQDEWIQLSDFPVSCSGAVGFSLNGIGYVGTGKNDSQYFDTFYKYESSTDSWIPFTSLPKNPRAHAIAFKIKNAGYVCGGENDTTTFKSAYKISSGSVKWARLEELPEKISRGFGLSESTAGWIVGGSQWKNGELQALSTIYRWSRSGKTWQTFDDFPSGTVRSGFAIYNQHDDVYVGGGSINNNNPIDPANNIELWKFKGAGMRNEQTSSDMYISSDVMIYSNGDGNINIVNSPATANVKVLIYDLAGRVLCEKTLSALQQSFQFRPNVFGMFICSVFADGRLIKSSKILYDRE